MVEGGRSSGKGFQGLVQLFLEIIALHEALVGLRQFRQGRHQRLGHKEASVPAELDCGCIGYLTMQKITGLYVSQCTN